MVRVASYASTLFLVGALLIQIVPCISVLADDGDPQATGLNQPTQSEIEWINDNFPVVQKIRLNSLALQRINAERQSRGLKQITVSDKSLASMGEEAVFTNSFYVIDQIQENVMLEIELPTSVDNSTSPAFPPIRSQGSIGSCACWATTYYQFTYETNLARGQTASFGNNSAIFSPKWSYDMINGGGDNGSSFSEAYALELKNGAATWADFPYDTNYLTWSLNPSAWNQALNSRPSSWGRISNSNVDDLISDIKTQLANGHVMVIGTYVTSWVQKVVGNDPSTTGDDAYNNQKIASYMKSSNQGGHGMTIVGYNDILWCDLNGNGTVDPGEKGAFKIANSWGTGDWNKGYRWVTYDALRATSTVPPAGTWPTSDRASSGIFWSGNIFTLTASPAYTPTLKAKVTLNHLKRGQMAISLGIGEVGATKPATTWNSKAVYNSGGNYAFDGTTSACDGTFYFDFSDLAKSVSGPKRWFVGVSDKTSGDSATIKSFDLYQGTPDGDVLVATCNDLPKSSDASQVYAWVDYSYSPLNQPPSAEITASPTGGNVPLVVNFDGSSSTDTDGTITSYAWAFGDSSNGSGATVSHTYNTHGQFTATLTVTDNSGATSFDNVVINAINPVKLAVTGYTSPAVSGDSHNFTVTAQDAIDNTIVDYAGTVHFSSSDSQAILPADYTFGITDNGTHSFSATLKTAGNQSISATDTLTGSTTGTQSGITVNYALNIATTGSGAVSRNPDQSTYNSGTTVTLTATGTTGWSFNNWSGDLTGSTNPMSITMNGNRTVTAIFGENDNLYGLNVSVVGQGSVTKNPDQESYTPGTSIQITATPAAGWTFSGWSGDATGSTNPLTVAMNDNKTITATFIQSTYALTVNISGSGSVNRNNPGPYYLNDVVQLTAIPATGWSFSGWSGAATGSTNPKNVTVTTDKSITATFIQNQYTMSITISGEGSVTKNPDLTNYNSGYTVQLTAFPESGWMFTGWSGDITGSTNTASVTMNSNKTLTATFTQNPPQYTLNINVVGQGSVTRNPAQASYDSGTSVQITAAPAAGWTFSGWSGDTTGTSNTITINMNSEKTINATFAVYVPPSSGGGSGGGGGGGGAPPIPVIKPVTTSGFSSSSGLKVDNSGTVQARALLKFGDSGANLDIAKNTQLYDAKGDALGALSVAELNSIAQPAPSREVIVKAYEFGPSGARFNPAIILTLSYDAEILPSETQVDSLHIAYWEGSQWMAVDSTIDNASHTVSTKVSHFSEYALIGRQAMVEETPMPTPDDIRTTDTNPEPVEASPKEVVTAPSDSSVPFVETSVLETAAPIIDSNSEQVPLPEKTQCAPEARAINLAGLLPICLAIFVISVISISFLAVSRKRSPR